MSELNVFVNPGIPVPTVEEEIPDDGHNRRGAFAAMRDLSDAFFNVGLHTEQVWAYLKTEAGVETRSQLTQLQWASIACRLQAMRRDPLLFKVFLDGIPDKHFRFYVLSTDPTIPVGRPRVPLKEYHKPEVWGNFQEIANDIGAELKVTQGKMTVYYEPKSVEPVAEVVKPRVIGNVYNEETGELLWRANMHKGFYATCQQHADQHQIRVRAKWDREQSTHLFVPAGEQVDSPNDEASPIGDAKPDFINVYRYRNGGAPPVLLMSLDPDSDWVSRCQAYCDKYDCGLKAVISERCNRFFVSKQEYERQRAVIRRQAR